MRKKNKTVIQTGNYHLIHIIDTWFQYIYSIFWDIYPICIGENKLIILKKLSVLLTILLKLLFIYIIIGNIKIKILMMIIVILVK